MSFLLAAFVGDVTLTSVEAFAFHSTGKGHSTSSSPLSSRYQNQHTVSFPLKQRERYHLNSNALNTALTDELMYSDAFSVPLLLAFALGVGFAAQTFINQMLEGEDGLGAFLTDGSGYNNSGFRKKSSKDNQDNIKTDPLPWLKLPELDFVEVAGQSKIMSEGELMMQLERLREGMKSAMEKGRLQEAESLRKELEQTMETYGVEFTSDES